MMKPTAKRRRSKQQIKDDKEKEKKQKEEITAKLEAWPQLEAELERAHEKVKWAENVN